MIWLFALVAVVAACFGLVVLRGAPYVPSLRAHIDDAFDLLDLDQDSLVVDIGAGDGRVMAAALERGYHAVGYELNPVLALVAWLRTRRYGDRARVVWGDALRREWPAEAAAVYVFGVQHVLPRIDQKLANRTGVRLVSVGFAVPGKKPTATKGAVHLYVY